MLFGDTPKLSFKVSGGSQEGVKFRSSVKFKIFHLGKFSLIFSSYFLYNLINVSVANFSAWLGQMHSKLCQESALKL